ncbi:MAG TPA: FapA family protein [Bacillales bacterium]|nr:FapA family protein [Bacillales bacterium]
MSTPNVFTGKTIEEAIANGLKHLGLTSEEVNIKVLNEGRKGFLKMGTKDAEVRIERKATQKPKDRPLQQGKVWIESGIIHCVDPAGDKEKLMVHIPPMVLLYKNNELMKEKGTISEQDQLKVDFKNEEIETKWKIEITKDRLTATIKVEPGTKTIYKLRDQKPAREVTLEATKTVLPNLTLTAEDIHKRLMNLGITAEIQNEQIDAACKAEIDGEFIIAKGESPVEGKNGWLEYLVDVKEGKSFKERKDGSIDFREGIDIPSITAGTTIAIIHDPIEGLAGRSVTGEVIKPKPVQPLVVKVRNGVQLSDQQILATSMGRPSVQKRGNTAIITVLPKLDHRGDVGLKSGNLKFNGDIVISGNVEHHMEVVANGSVEIRGTVSEAKIKAGQSITHYGNVIASEIVTGNSERIQISEKFETQVKTMNQLMEQSDFETEIGVFVQMPSAINSIVYSSGDVFINKQGCYNCTIFAEGSVEVKGFVRGGRLFAGLGARLEEAGSKGGTLTLICVPHDQIITIKNVFSETTIQIGKKVYKFTKDMTNIVARIDEQGNIAIR